MVRIKKRVTRTKSSKKRGVSATVIISISLLFIIAFALLYRSSTKSYDKEPRAHTSQERPLAAQAEIVSPKRDEQQKSVDKPKAKEPQKKEEKQIDAQKSKIAKKSLQSPSLELPYYSDSTYLIKNRDGRYTLNYSTLHKQALWVAYILTAEQVATKGTERKNNFVKDPQVVLHGWATATDKDYRKSGYDRGHLLPSADRDDNQRENNSTFLFSNISPQKAQLNRVTWNSLEQKVRRWATKHDSLYIVTGGILSGKIKSYIGQSQVSVPDHFYKAILAPSGGSYKAIGFIMPNRVDISKDIFEYVIPIDSIESRTGFDLFSPLGDELEERLESSVDINFWK